MSLYSIPPLVSCVLFLILGLTCLKRRTKANITFALMCLTTIWWQGSWTILFNIKDPNTAAILVRIGYSGIIFIPITFYHFTIEFLNRNKEKILIWLSYILGIGFLISLWTTDLLIRGYYTYHWGYYPKASLILHPVYLLMLTLQAGRILYLLYTYHEKKEFSPIKRNQVRFMFWAIFFYAFASADFANNYGFKLYPMGVYAISLSFMIIGYTIYKYKLLDIHFIIRKILTNLFLAVMIWCIICITYYPRINILTLSLGFAIAFLVVLFTPMLKLRTENVITHILYKGKYDYLDRFEKFIKKLTVTLKEDDLIKDTAVVLTRDMYTEKVTLLIRDHITGNYVVRYKINLSSTNEIVLSQESKIINWLKKHKRTFVLEEEEKILSNEEIQIIRKELEVLEAKICVPARLNSDLIGIIALGNKTTGEMYTHIDLELLEQLGSELAVALDYKRLEAELRKKQEYEAVGKLAFEITHEMKNLMVPVKTFLQLVPERKDDPEFIDGFRRIAETHLDVMNRKVEDILFFGKKQVVNLSFRIDINKTLKNVTDGLRPLSQEKGFEITEELSELPLIMADSELMVHVFNNLIINAMDAMKGKKGKIMVRSKKHPYPSDQMKNLSNKWIRIEVEDEGEGILPEIKDKIFDAFVTTKMGGDEMKKSGMGLGLAVVKRIVDVHHGIIGVDTTIGKGTTFIIDLPVDQKV